MPPRSLSCARKARPPSASRSAPLAQPLDELCPAILTLALQPLRRQNRFELSKAGGNIAVDDGVVVLRPMAHLVGRLGHAPSDDFGRVLGARDQPLLEVARRRRQDE